MQTAFVTAYKILDKLLTLKETSLQNDERTKDLFVLCQSTASTLTLLEVTATSAKEVEDGLVKMSGSGEYLYKVARKSTGTPDGSTWGNQSGTKEQGESSQDPTSGGESNNKLSGTGKSLSDGPTADSTVVKDKEGEAVQDPAVVRQSDTKTMSSLTCLEDELKKAETEVKTYMSEKKQPCGGLTTFFKAKYWEFRFKKCQDGIRQAIIGLSLNLNAHQHNNMRSMREELLSKLNSLVKVMHGNRDMLIDILETPKRLQNFVGQSSSSKNQVGHSGSSYRPASGLLSNYKTVEHQTRIDGENPQETPDASSGFSFHSLFPRTAENLGFESYGNYEEALAKYNRSIKREEDQELLLKLQETQKFVSNYNAI